MSYAMERYLGNGREEETIVWYRQHAAMQNRALLLKDSLRSITTKRHRRIARDIITRWNKAAQAQKQSRA